MSKYVMALDQGTTSSRAIIFDEHQNIVNMAQKEFTQHYPKAGWVEHDPLEIYASQYGVLVEVLARSGMEAGEISAIGITNQRETTIVWDKNTGRPVYNAIVWQCRRTSDFCTNLVERGYADEIRACSSTHISARQKSSGSWTMWRAHVSGPSGANFYSAPWTPGSSGS